MFWLPNWGLVVSCLFRFIKTKCNSSTIKPSDGPILGVLQREMSRRTITLPLTVILALYLFLCSHLIRVWNFSFNRSSFRPTNGAVSTSPNTSQTLGWRSSQILLAISSPSALGRSCRKSCRSRWRVERPSKMCVLYHTQSVLRWRSGQWGRLFLYSCINMLSFLLQMIGYVREEMKKTSISEQTMIGIVWTSVMSSVEWNKKEELVTEQAIKHLKVRDGSHLSRC